MRQQIILSINPFKVEQNVVDYGLAIGQKLNLPILIYAVLYSPSPIMIDAGLHAHHAPEQVPTNLQKEAESKLEKLCNKMQKVWPQTSYEFDLGFMADSIVDKSRWFMKEAGRRDPFMIILEKSSEYNWWNEVFGTTETRIAGSAPCPVMMLPPDSHYQGFRRLMYLVDHDTSELKNAEALSALFGAYELTISGIYLAEEEESLSEEALKEKMNRLFEPLSAHSFFHYQFQPQNTAEEIMNIAEWSQTDIIAFPFQKTNFISKIFGNENTETLILKASVPVIVF